MTGLVVVAHFSLAKEMVAATELIVGKQKQFEAIGIFPDESVDAIKERIVQALKKTNSGDGIIILTDMFGGGGVQDEAKAPRYPCLPDMQVLPSRPLCLRRERRDRGGTHDLHKVRALVPDHRRDSTYAP